MRFLQSFLFLVVVNCAVAPTPKSNEKNSIIAYQSMSKGLSLESTWLGVTLKKVGSPKRIESVNKNGYNYICNIEPGKYIIRELAIPTPGAKIVAENSYDTVDIMEDSFYYLGNFDFYFKPFKFIGNFDFKELPMDSSKAAIMRQIDSLQLGHYSHLRSSDLILSTINRIKASQNGGSQ